MPPANQERRQGLFGLTLILSLVLSMYIPYHYISGGSRMTLKQYYTHQDVLTIDDLDTQEILMFEYEPNRYNLEESNQEISQIDHVNEMKKLAELRGALDEQIEADGFQRFSFNNLISNRIGLIRPLPDYKPVKCPTHKKYRIYMTVSIVICYFNESPSALLRTLHTILARTPDKHLREIHVIDDFSEDEYRHTHIEHLINSTKVHFGRTYRREGLIRARQLGARIASGDIVVFLDSHVEPNIGWLEPLVDEIEKDQTNVVSPIIDIINSKTLNYGPAAMVRGGMDWGLRFKWDSIPGENLKTAADFAKPIHTATFAGGIYAMYRKFFLELDGYDEGMEVWGGENIEMSLRIWMCGGRLAIVPCSRVGHIFRKERPYGPRPKDHKKKDSRADSLYWNLQRTAEVWMDDYKEYFYRVHPKLRHLYSGDLYGRHDLRRAKNCSSFKWYLENIYPQLLTSIPGERAPVVDLKPTFKRYNLTRSQGLMPTPVDRAT